MDKLTFEKDTKIDLGLRPMLFLSHLTYFYEINKKPNSVSVYSDPGSYDEPICIAIINKPTFYTKFKNILRVGIIEEILE